MTTLLLFSVRSPFRLACCLLFCWVTVLCVFLPIPTVYASNNPSLILRVRLPDGSLQRLAISPDSIDTLSLQDALEKLLVAKKKKTETVNVHLGTSKQTVDPTKSLAELGVKHGSLLTVFDKESKKAPPSASSILAKNKKAKEKQSSFVPFPDLAKDYATALLKAKTKQRGGRSSYKAMADLQSELHTVEPQPEGSLKRLYMCATSAERFQMGCIHVNPKTNPQPQIYNRVGLLFGTIQRERVDKKPKPKTSLSSTIAEDEYCTVAKVHALWEPSLDTKQTEYDASVLQSILNNNNNNNNESVLRIANWLDLKPIGWIFTYNDADSKTGKRDTGEDDVLPVLAQDIQVGAQLQIANMKRCCSSNNNNSNHPKNDDDERRLEGAKFCTVVMDATSGATEVFQLSDVAVQMVAEDMFQFNHDNDNDNTAGIQKAKTNKKKKKKKNKSAFTRHVTTRYPVLVDGKETKELDSVFCLVNTALLSHPVGLFAGGKTFAVKRKNTSTLTAKTKKALLTALQQRQQQNDNNKLLDLLCDFHVLLALDAILTHDESKLLCQTVRKYARGQKRSTVLDSKLVQKLQTVLEQY